MKAAPRGIRELGCRRADPVPSGAVTESRLRVAAAVFGLGVVAVVHPVLEVIAGAPGFLVAHAVTGWEVALFLGMLTAVALAVAVLAAAASLGVAAVAVLVALISAHVAVRFGLGLVPVVSLAAAAGAAAGVAYLASAATRRAASWAALTLVPVLGLFLFRLPASLFDLPPEAAGEGSRPVDVIVIVLDELPTSSLLDGDGNFDYQRLPGLGRIAADGTWYRDAVTVETGTARSVPAILTGRRGEPQAVPIAADYPDNLMALLASTHVVTAVEDVTRLCPVCAHRRLRPQWTSVAADVATIYAHLVLPSEQADRLAPLGHVWANFGEEEFDLEERLDAARARDRRMSLESVVAAVSPPPEQPFLLVAHLMLPHRPWAILPDGTTYSPRWPPGYGLRGWGPDELMVGEGWRRHLLQLAYVDAGIGRLVAALEAADRYRQSLIVVVADHGVAFLPDVADMRSTNAETAPWILPVPLLVKFPESTTGAPPPGSVVEARVTTLDIVPTIVDVLGTVRPPDSPPLEGRSLLEARPPAESTVIELVGEVFRYPAGTAALADQARRRSVALPAGHRSVGAYPDRVAGARIGRRLEVSFAGPLVEGVAPAPDLDIGLYAGEVLVGLTRSYLDDSGTPVFAHVLYPEREVVAHVLEGG